MMDFDLFNQEQEDREIAQDIQDNSYIRMQFLVNGGSLEQWYILENDLDKMIEYMETLLDIPQTTNLDNPSVNLMRGPTDDEGID